MKENLIDTARSGKVGSLGEVLTRIQRMYRPNSSFLICEDWDWLVVLQCMQDHHLFKSNPKRPPLGAFVQWLNQQGIRQRLAKASVYEMSLASRNLRGARYPWADVMWEPYVLERWRILYRQLDRMLTEKSCDTKTIS